MATTPKYKRDEGIKTIIRIFVKNNPKSVEKSLNENHIYLEKPSDLKKVLYSLSKLQPLVFKKVLKDANWDYNEPITNSTEILEKIGLSKAQARTGEVGQNAKGIFEQVLDVVVGSDTSETQTTSTTVEDAKGGMMTKVIIGSVVLLVLGGIIWMLLSFNKGGKS